MVRPPLAHLPRLFRSLSRVPRKNSMKATDIITLGIIKGDFLLLY